ncbi:hypothetical protein F444_22601 [Phytophthora nicotianae P1976]|uniref:Uncharacterized protein n=1 Tax=Phytophthora nicotianae P1976 TaxID=1317066 RepID=A0A080YXB1_PHYNI|nr:hypothetical protein F444_22601 [Phytophthora nicotianae P1976]
MFLRGKVVAPVRVGTKRDRDERRQQLRQRLDETERVNATSAEEESPASKLHRKNRCKARSRELDLLSQQVNIVSVADSSTVTSGVPAVPVTTAVGLAVAPTINTSSAAAVRMSDAERARARRANMSSSQRERARQRNAERQRLRMAQRRAEEVKADRERSRLSHQAQRLLCTQIAREHEREQQVARRSQQTEAHRAALRERDTEARARRRSQQTGDQRNADRERHTNARVKQSDESRDAQREHDRERHEDGRALQTEEVREEERERVRERRRTTRDALANHENFRPSMFTGPDVNEVTRRHRLPLTTVCAHRNAWKWPGESKVGCCLEGKVKLPPLAPAPAKLLQLYGDPEF